MSNVLKLFWHFAVILVLTVITQLGGLIYLFSFIAIPKKTNSIKLKRLLLFLLIYTITNLFLVPNLAPQFGRVKIEDNSHLKAHSWFYKVAFRNYVRPELNKVLLTSSKKLSKISPGIQLVYLDANFPFINKFPLLPHLSHNDGKKIDITFLYADQKGITNRKPSRSGYGIFEEPSPLEINQTERCKAQGYFQYDYTKYLTLGNPNKNLDFSVQGTRLLLEIILSNNLVGKVLIEPHLKTRMKLNNAKVRFQGCQAVRHDDHIHVQLR